MAAVAPILMFATGLVTSSEIGYFSWRRPLATSAR